MKFATATVLSITRRSLLSIVTKYSGKFSWLSFLIGGFISLMTAFSYYDLAIEKDITQESAPEQAISTIQDYFGRIDVLINNAGSNIRKRPEELSSDDFRWVLETNLTSAFLFSQAVYPAMKKARESFFFFPNGRGGLRI